MVEKWRNVAGWEDLYEVSDLGRVRSVERIVLTPRFERLVEHKRKARILAPSKASNGYRHLILSRDGEKVTKSVHDLVCTAFHGPRPDGHTVAHNDGSRCNNAAANLRWASQADNLADRAGHGTAVIGETHGRSKLTKCDVAAIRASPSSQRQLARQFGVSKATIGKIQARLLWRHIA